jgi:hypothetical protein
MAGPEAQQASPLLGREADCAAIGRLLALAGCSGLTREAYGLDLRQYASWCHQRHIRLFQARLPGIECFAPGLETRGRRASPGRRVSCRRACPLR